MKKALALLLVVIMALLLASCGSKDDAPAAEARQSENQTTNMAGVGAFTTAKMRSQARAPRSGSPSSSARIATVYKASVSPGASAMRARAAAMTCDL